MSPLALNAFLNSTVSFTCSGRGSGPSLLFTTISWRVNGALVNTSEGIYHIEFNTTNNLSLAYSTLSFTASPEFNNTSVLCTVSTVGLTPPSLEHADAPLAHLKLQGKEGERERKRVVSTVLTCIVSVLLVYDVMFTLPPLYRYKLNCMSICCCCWVCIQ